MTLRGHKSYYNVKLLRGYEASISLRNKKVYLKGGKDIFAGHQEKGRLQCDTGTLQALSQRTRERTSSFTIKATLARSL
jgi:hypothetical protein